MQATRPTRAGRPTPLSALLCSLPLACLTGVACQSSGGDSERDPEQMLEVYRETAYGHWENEDPSRAAAQALKALEIDPDDHSMRLILGWGLLRLGKRDDLIRARGVFQSIRDYEDYRAQLGLAIVNERLGVLWEEAGDAFQEGNRTPPEGQTAQSAHAEAYTIWREAVALYEGVLVEQPEERKAINGLQRVHGHLGEFDVAMRYTLELLDRTDKEIVFFEQQLQRPELTDVEEDRYRENLRILEDSKVKSHLYAAEVLRMLDRPEAAIEHLDHLLVVDPDQRTAYSYRAQHNASLRRWDEAIGDLDRFLALAVDMPYEHPDVREAFRLRTVYETELLHSLDDSALETAGVSDASGGD